MKQNTPFKQTRSLLLFIAFSLLAISSVNGQIVNFTINNPRGVNVCDEAEQSTIEILNITNQTLTNGSLTITFPTGVLYEPSSLVDYSIYNMQEVDISDLSSVTFSFSNLPVAEKIEFAFSFKAGMEAITYQDNNNVFRNTFDITTAEGSNTKTSNAYNLYYPVISITDVDPSKKTLTSGESMTRDIVIFNAGNGRASEFYVDDTHDSGIEIISVNKGTLDETKSRITLIGSDFASIGNGDNYFDTNESITITELISASGCQEGTITSTIVNSWGCEDIIQGSNNYAHVTLTLKTPNIVVSTTEELNACFGLGTPSNHTITLKNNGQGVADEVVLEIFKSLGSDYDEDIFSRIDETNITYQFTGGELTPITPRVSTPTNTSGDYDCLGDGAIGKVLLDLPNIEAGETVVVSFQTIHCKINACNGDHVSGWRYILNYSDFCKTHEYDNFANGQSPADTYLTIFPETPTDIRDGETDIFDFTISSFSTGLPVGDDARAKVVFTIPDGLIYESLEFEHNGVWEPIEEPVFDESTNTLTAYYEVPPPTGFSIAKARFHLELTGDCSEDDGGYKTINLEIDYIPEWSCDYEIPFSCGDEATVFLHCPDPDCEGMSFYNFTLERISFGLPDNDQNGLPDASGELDMTQIKTHRAMFGDTLRGTFFGKVKADINGGVWDYGFAIQDIDQGEYLQPIEAYIKIFDVSDGLYKEAVGLDLVPSSEGKYVYDINVNDLASLNPDFNGYRYSNGDSVWVYAEYKIIENIKNNIIQLTSDNEYYLSNNATYDSDSNTKYQCDHFDDNYTLIGSYYVNDYFNSRNITSCSGVVKQDFKLSIGDCCSNFSGGNIFPYEYRYWAHPKTAIATIPANYTLESAYVAVRRTVKTNATTMQVIYDIDYEKDGDTYTFDLDQYYTSGQFEYPDDGFNGTIYLTIAPNCDVPLNTWEDIIWTFDFDQSVYLGDGTSPTIVASRNDRVKFNPPALKVLSENPVMDGLEKTVVWDLKVATDNSGTDAQYAWLHIKNPSGEVTILQVINDDTGEEIPITGDVYHIGDIDGGSPTDLSIVASYGACVPDYITAYAGYECTGFPATFADFKCSFTTLGLFVEPKPAKMQVALYGDDVGEECSNVISIELEILSSKFASVDNIAVEIQPVGGTISFQNGSGVLEYPTDNGYTSIQDPTTTANGYSYSLNELNSFIDENGLLGVLNIGDNLVKLKFNMVMSDDFVPGDYILINVSGQAVCGEDIPTIYLAYDPSLGFKLNTLAGITDNFTNSWSVSWGDYNRDGYDDLYVTTYNDDEANYLYENNGDKTFTKITTGAIATEKSSSIASTWGDYNNDGFLDLFVANNVGYNNSLYKNNGDGSFTKIFTGAIVENGVYCHSAAWADFDNDGYLDLFVAEYFPTKTNHLFRNNGDETFTPVEGSPVVEDAGHSIGAAWGDYNNDGLIDLFVPNTEGEGNWLYKNIGNGNFVKVNEDVVSTPSKSVGCSWGDYNNDKYLDLFIANAGGEANFLYQNNGDGTFTSITEGHIVNAMSNSHGSAWFDIDNDGFLDLYVTNDQEENNFLYRNNGDGTFTNQDHPIVELGGNSFGTAVSDYDNDGDFDLFVANHSLLKDFFFENTKGQCNNYLCFTVQGINSNYSGIGMKACVKANIYGKDIWQTREVSAQSGGGAGSQSSMKVIFGLGDATIVDSLIMEWPSGYKITYTDVAVNSENCQVYLEGQGAYICGVAYLDENGNCEFDEDDILLKNAEITIEPNNKTTYTNVNGEYGFYMNSGSYNINANDMTYYSNSCPVGGDGYDVVVTDDELGNDYCGKDFGFSKTTDKPDLTACLSTTMLRVNFTNDYTVVYENLGPVAAYDDTLTMTFDEGIDIVSSTIPWDVQDGQTLIWYIDEIAPQEQVVFYVTDSVTSTVTLGEYGTNTVRIGTGSIEANYDNNGCDDTEMYVGAVDPNDKLVYPDEGVYQGDPITYKIRFQNVGNFPADNVTVYDTLVDMLDPTSIFNIQTSHDDIFTILDDNVLKWEFPEIYLADSVNNEPESHGYIQFSIYPYEEVNDYSEITNNAMIIFDYYQYTPTNTTVIQVRPEKEEGIHIFDVSIDPNPVTDLMNISFTSDSKTEILITVISSAGKEVLRWSINTNIGFNNISYKIPQKLEGVYFVTLKTSEVVATEKIIISD